MDPLLTALINLGATGVMSGVFWVCWQKADKKRDEVQTELNALGKRSIEADFTMAKSMDNLSGMLNALITVLTADLQRRP